VQVADYRPRYSGFVAESQQSFEKDGRKVGVYVAYYRAQRKGSELVTSENLLTARNNAQWKLLDETTDTVDWDGRNIGVGRAALAGRDVRLQLYKLYWIAGHATSNDYVAKLLLGWSRLLGRGDDAALVMLYAPMTERSGDARSSLQAFGAQMSPSIARALDATRAGGD